MMAFFRGADELVVRAVESLDHGLEARHIAFDQLLGRKLLLGRGLQHLDAMLVGTGQEQDVVPVEPHETRYCVGCDRFIGVADVRRPIWIGDGGSEIVAGLVSHSVFPRDTGPGRFRSDSSALPRVTCPSPAIACPRYQPRDASA